MNAIDINSPQIKSAIRLVVIAMPLVVFMLFIGLPYQQTVTGIKKEITQANLQMQKISSQIKNATVSAQKRKKLLDDKEVFGAFPLSEEDGLKEIFYAAKKLNIELAYVTPSQRMLFVNKDKEKIDVDGKSCYRVTVNLGTQCYYRDVVDYIAALKKAMPGFITVDSLSMDKKESGTTKLQVDMDVSFYFFLKG